MGQNQTNPFKQNQDPILQDRINIHQQILPQQQQNKLQFIKRVTKKHTNHHKLLNGEEINVKQKQQVVVNNSMFYGTNKQEVPKVAEINHAKQNKSRSKILTVSPSKNKQHQSVEKRVYLNPTLVDKSKSPSKNINTHIHQSLAYRSSNQPITTTTNPPLFSTQYIQQPPPQTNVHQPFKEIKYMTAPQPQSTFVQNHFINTATSRQLPKQQIKMIDGKKDVIYKQSNQVNLTPNLTHQNVVPFQSTYNKQLFSSINMDHSLSKSKQLDQPNYFPSHINQFIQPTHSIHYETNKNSFFNDVSKDNQILTHDLKTPINHKAQFNEHKVQSHPQYVEEQFKVGSRYIGYKMNGQRHGKGTFYYQDGGCYDGDWCNNKMEGYGTLYYQSGKVAYEGQWMNDQFHGKGKLYNQVALNLEDNFNYENFDDIDEYWEFYEGDFVEDLKNGKGKLRFSNGQLFDGTFKQDMVEGEGSFYTRSGQAINGFWRQNFLQKILN